MSFGSLFLLVIGALIFHLVTASSKKRKSRGKRSKGFSPFSRKKSKAKTSWYWGNERWRKIRQWRKEENTSRYRLPDGTCRCERCGETCKGRDIHCDHIWPRKPYWFLQYCYWNTQILCSKCNIKKSNRKGHNWRRLRQLGLHPVVWYLRWRQHRLGLR